MRLALFSCLLLLVALPALAEPTDITVRVIARNADLVGDLVDGAFVTITDTRSGEMLAQGITTGAAGNPRRATTAAPERSAASVGEHDAKFVATLEIDRPRHVNVTAFGPLGKRYTGNRVSASQWVVPGKHLTGGNGWVLELPGLLVVPNIAEKSAALSAVGDGVTVEAEVLLMCGCEIKANSRWLPEHYEVGAIVRRGDSVTHNLDFRFTGASSEFEATLLPTLPGVYRIDVYAYDEANGNTGVGQIELTITDD